VPVTGVAATKLLFDREPMREEEEIESLDQELAEDFVTSWRRLEDGRLSPISASDTAES